MVDFSLITDEQWATWDDHRIAKAVGCSACTVASKRKALGHPKVRKPGSGRRPTFDINLFRLEESDRWNSNNLGITVQRAGQVRKKLKNENWI